MQHKISQRLDIYISRMFNANLLTINNTAMKRNNLENLREEMKALGFKDKLIAEMEKKMEANVPQFTLHDSIA